MNHTFLTSKLRSQNNPKRDFVPYFEISYIKLKVIRTLFFIISAILNVSIINPK